MTGRARPAAWFVALLALVWAGLAPVATAAPMTVRMEGDFAGRFYLIDLPDQPAGAPLIVALHGGGGNPAQFARTTGLARPALAEGFAVVWPAGSARFGQFRSWNGGHCCAYAQAQGVDDVAFLDAVVKDAVARFGLDGAAVAATGMSNGAIMAQHWAARGETRLAALATVAGTMALQDVGREVPLLHIHGTADDRVPFGGGPGGPGTGRAEFAPVETVMEAFRRPFGRGLTGEREVIDPVADGMRVIQSDWRDRRGRLRQRLLTVEGGGHAWPGGRRAPRQGGTEDITANAEILLFLSQIR